MKRFALLLILLLAAPFVLAHETKEPHEAESCSAVPEEGGRSCSFPTAGAAPQTFREWMIVKFRPGFEADTAGYWAAGILGALVLCIAILRWRRTHQKKGRFLRFWAKALGSILIALAAVFIAYSAYVYWYNDISTEGLITCDDTGCRISMHWHATINEMKVCGKDVERPWESGDLGGPHTHKDNRIHLHTILPVNVTSHEILDKTPLTLGAFFDAIGWQFETNCFKDTCDFCGETPAVTTVMVNGIMQDEVPRNVLWKDGDTVRVVFG
jgi:hypothetical protein